MSMKFQFRKVKKEFWRWMVMTVTQQYECISCHLTIPLKMIKMVNFTLWVFYYNKKGFNEGFQTPLGLPDSELAY